mmetsp:Transcript_5402/g.16548  ORF Transcript_5402/g.16548 Transcript_5402/m.16548 type:complete len:434 (+) Transcript_5402:259-1560(+)
MPLQALRDGAQLVALPGSCCSEAPAEGRLRPRGREGRVGGGQPRQAGRELGEPQIVGAAVLLGQAQGRRALLLELLHALRKLLATLALLLALASLTLQGPLGRGLQLQQLPPVLFSEALGRHGTPLLLGLERRGVGLVRLASPTAALGVKPCAEARELQLQRLAALLLAPTSKLGGLRQGGLLAALALKAPRRLAERAGLRLQPLAQGLECRLVLLLLLLRCSFQLPLLAERRLPAQLPLALALLLLALRRLLAVPQLELRRLLAAPQLQLRRILAAPQLALLRLRAQLLLALRRLRAQLPLLLSCFGAQPLLALALLALQLPLLALQLVLLLLLRPLLLLLLGTGLALLLRLQCRGLTLLLLPLCPGFTLLLLVMCRCLALLLLAHRRSFALLLLPLAVAQSPLELFLRHLAAKQLVAHGLQAAGGTLQLLQ